jgi:hypothetical protein
MKGTLYVSTITHIRMHTHQTIDFERKKWLAKEEKRKQCEEQVQCVCDRVCVCVAGTMRW